MLNSKTEEIVADFRKKKNALSPVTINDCGENPLFAKANQGLPTQVHCFCTAVL